MAYRTDIDLEFLGDLPSEDLNDLVYCLTHVTAQEVGRKWLRGDSEFDSPC